jgi:hypothetical protein
MGKQFKMLYLLECRQGYYGRLFPFYAIDEEEAQNKVKHILRDHPHLIQEKLTQQPQGFLLVRHRLPGRISSEEVTRI